MTQAAPAAWPADGARLLEPSISPELVPAGCQEFAYNWTWRDEPLEIDVA